MFGYLQIQKSELLVREYEAYKAVYCGLCRQMGRDYSFLTRMILSYDCTCYAVILMSLRSSCTGFKKGRCSFNPLKKCPIAADSSDAYRKAAAFSVISAYYKLIDDINDSGLLKSPALRAVKPLFSHWRKKAARRYSEIERIVFEMAKLQRQAESDESCEVDKAAHPTAHMLGSLFALEAESERDKRVFYEFGYQIGRWIYFIDAADDIERDRKSGNFNPFGSDTDGGYIISVLNQSLARAYDAYSLMNIKDFKGILDNMILMGFPAVQNRVTKKFKTEDVNEQSI